MAEALDKGVNTTTKTEEMEILLPEEDYEGKESIEEMEVVLKQEVDALREEIDKKTNELIEMKKKITDVLSEKLGPERAHDEDFQKTLSAIKNQKSLIEMLEREMKKIKTAQSEPAVSWCSEDLSFPPTFKFGAASSSYQVEGAWNVSDKSESVWDHEVHKRPEIVADGTNGDIACDSYHKYKEDVSIASKLGLHFYRFSISWPRLLPTGFPEYISEDGKNYYSKLIDELLDSGIEPVVTLFHWDLPQRLQEMGGWTNPLIADWFADYSRVVYSLYADRVKTWITINEPIVICEGGFVSGPVAPRTSDPPYENYICNKHTLLAHAKAWRVYDEEFRAQYNGQVAIDNHAVWYEAASPADEEMAEITMQYNVGRYSHAIYSAEGGWPPEIERIIAENSIKQGFRRSRLPTFTKEEIELVKGTYDYYAVNHYTSRLVRKAKPGEKTGNGLLEGAKEYGAVFEGNADWPQSAAQWLLVNPVGIRNQLKWLKQRYGDLKFFIAENGFPRLVAGLEDDDRVDFYKKYLAEVLRAIKEDGVNVVAYTAWTLLDNFEWVEGLRVKFGLYQVDFADPERKRTARKSAHYYRSVIEHHSLDVPDQYARNEL